MPPENRAPRDEFLVRASRPGPELRAAGSGTPPTMVGHFTVFNEWTEINSIWEGHFLESIAPGAFRKTFREKRDAIRAIFQHGMDPSIGDKPLGRIEELKEDEVGAYYEVPLLDAPYVREDILPGLEAGLYGASFAFRVTREDLNQKPEPSDYNPSAMPERVIREVELFEFGPVTFPAYPSATAGVRSLTDQFIAAKRPALRGQLEAKQAAAAAPSAPVDAGAPLHLDDPERRDAPPVDAGPAPHLDGPPPGATTTAAPKARPSAGPLDSRKGKRMPPQNAAPTIDLSALDEFRTVEEMETERDERRSRLDALDNDHAGRVLPADAQVDWERLNAEFDELQRRIDATNQRRARLEQLGTSERRTVPGDGGQAGAYAPIPTIRGRTSEISTPSEIRALSRSDDEYRQLLRDNAMRSVERAVFPHPIADQARVRSHIERLLEPATDDESLDKGAAEIARRILNTGTPLYRRAFGKYLANKGMTPEEQRALSIGTGSAGGFAVVYTLDPTIVPTSNFSVNPYRALARIETIAGTNEWKAITSGAVTAAYAAEATEASDNAPTLAQPDIIAEKAQAYVPFSIEAGQDWSNLSTEMATLFQDAKDDLEATKFALGAGHGSLEPKGLITAATATTAAGGVATFAIADLYKLLEALPPRFRPRAQFVANLFAYNKVRQFDTAGGSGVWDIANSEGQLQAGAGGFSVGSRVGTLGTLLGRPAWESTAMAAALTTGSKILALGDFRYFVIVDRVGMDVEVLPLVVGTNHRPTGQRGLYAYWRNSSDVLSAAAFQVLVTS